MAKSEIFDLVIVGAGISGIGMAALASLLGDGLSAASAAAPRRKVVG